MKRKNRTEFVITRFTPEQARLLAKVCNSRGEDISDFVRRAVLRDLARLSYLTENEKKALGLEERR